MNVAEIESRLLERRAVTTKFVQKKETVKRCLHEQIEQSQWQTLRINQDFDHGNSVYLQRQRELKDVCSLENLVKVETTYREQLEREVRAMLQEVSQLAVEGVLEALRKEGNARTINKRVVKGEESARGVVFTYERLDRQHLVQCTQQSHYAVLCIEEQRGSDTLIQHSSYLRQHREADAAHGRCCALLRREQTSLRAQLEWSEDEVRSILAASLLEVG